MAGSEDVGQGSRRDSCDRGPGSTQRKANDTSLRRLESRSKNAGWFIRLSHHLHITITLSSFPCLIHSFKKVSTTHGTITASAGKGILAVMNRQYLLSVTLQILFRCSPLPVSLVLRASTAFT